MSAQHHLAKFTWGAGPQVVTVAGNFNNWSADASPLQKQADGSFAAEVPLPWGEKQAFKYVVDGEWKVREDEAKEWDAAGNMNNVYTAPHAPVTGEKSASSQSASADSAPTHTHATAASTAIGSGSTAHHSEYATTTDTLATDRSHSTSRETETAPSNLLSSSAPAPASAGSAGGIPSLGAVAGTPSSKLGPTAAVSGVTTGVTTTYIPVGATTTTTVSSTEPEPAASTTSASPIAAVTAGLGKLFGTSETAASETNTTGTFAADTTGTTVHAEKATVQETPLATAQTATQPTPTQPEPSNVAIQKLAASANVGEASTAGEHSILERASEYGAGAAAAIGGLLGSAAAAVESATGIDLTHGEPLTVSEAKARGIDLNSAERVDARTDAVSPVGTKPSASGADALEEKVQALKVEDQRQTSVPLPQGSAAPAPLPENDETLHDLPAQGETKENHTRVPMPSIVAVSAKDPAKDRTIDSKSAKDTATTKPISNDPAVDPKRAKEDAQENPGLPGSSLQSSTVASTGTAVASPDATSSNVNAGQPARAPAPVHKDAPQPVTKDTPTSVPIAAGVAASPVAPATPGKVDGAAVSASSTPASTPAKSTHGRETSADGVKPKKSGFLQKIKHAFKDKK